MRFLESSQLAWGLTALVPLVLYLFRRKPRRVPVSSLLFFKTLAREHRESAWLRWLKRLLSLLLTLIVIGGAVGALARLVVSPPAGEVRSVTIVVDRSASMAARDETGVTRLDAALRRVRARLSGLPGGVSVMLIAFDRQAEIAVPKTYDRRVIDRALTAMEVRPIEGDFESALKLATQLAALETPAAIWFASDTLAAPGTTAGVRVDALSMPLAKPRNVGITAFDIRRLPLEPSKCEAFVEIQGVSPDAIETKVEVRIDGALTAVRELTLQPNARESLLLPIDANAGKLLSVSLHANGDQLADDNEVRSRIPDARTLRVLWVNPEVEAFTQLALTAISREGELAIFRAAPSAWPPKEEVDAVIFQNWLPKEWPANVPAVVINPPSSLGPVQAVRLQGDGLPVDHVRATRERHPLLYGVATARLAIMQTAALAADGALEPLWTASTGPLLAAGDIHGQRVVVLGFAPEQSENLPLSASYPLLLGNAIHWVAQPKTESPGTRVQRTGGSVALHGQNIIWDKTQTASAKSAQLRNGWASLDRGGLWETDGGDTGSAALLSARETLLPAGSASTEETHAHLPWLRGDLTVPLLVLVLTAFLLESWLFHRHAVH